MGSSPCGDAWQRRGSGNVWRCIEADGCAWEARVITGPAAGMASPRDRELDLLEFRPLDGLRPPRRTAIRAGELETMDDVALRAAYRRALPIGGDHYGRPGKRMGDAGPGT